MEEYQKIWSDFDKEATGKIPVRDLKLLILRLADAHEDEGGALIPFKEECKAEDQNFLNR